MRQEPNSIPQAEPIQQTGVDGAVFEFEHASEGAAEFFVGGGAVLAGVAFDGGDSRNAGGEAG